MNNPPSSSARGAFAARTLLLANLNEVEDAYARADNADAVFAIMQAKDDLGLPVSREGYE
jgi:hypothetical protein